MLQFLRVSLGASLSVVCMSVRSQKKTAFNKQTFTKTKIKKQKLNKKKIVCFFFVVLGVVT